MHGGAFRARHPDECADVASNVMLSNGERLYRARAVGLEVVEQVDHPIGLLLTIGDRVEHNQQVDVRFLVRLSTCPGSEQDHLAQPMAIRVLKLGGSLAGHPKAL